MKSDIITLPRFFRTEVKLRSIFTRMRRDETLYRAVMESLSDIPAAIRRGTAIIDQEADDKLVKQSKDFLVILLTGEEGTRKSGVGQYLGAKYQALKTQEPFCVSQDIGMQYDDFISKFKVAPRGHVVVLDEQGKLHGAGSTRIIDDLLNLKKTCRANEVSMILITQEVEKITDEDVHLVIECLAYDGPYVLCVWKRKGKEYLGSFIVTLEWNNPVWLEYESTIKKSFVEDAKALNFKKMDYEAEAEALLATPAFAACTLRKERAYILTTLRPNITGEEKKLLMTAIDMKLKARMGE